MSQRKRKESTWEKRSHDIPRRWCSRGRAFSSKVRESTVDNCLDHEFKRPLRTGLVANAQWNLIGRESNVRADGANRASEPERYALKTSRIVKISKTAQTTVSSCNKKTSGRRGTKSYRIARRTYSVFGASVYIALFVFGRKKKRERDSPEASQFQNERTKISCSSERQETRR